jgi:phenylacetate-coenzyme A ligase PaaK-like adenylate-forming protein
MLPPFDFAQTCTTALDVMAAGVGSAAALAMRRESRLAALLANAVEHSPLYREAFGSARSVPALSDFPAASKAALMARFDDWVTDSALKIDEVKRFVADRSCIAEPLLGRYVVWESSGSSGAPGLFVQDAAAMAVYDALEAFRRPVRPAWSMAFDPFQTRQRMVFVGATDGHFASNVSIERLRRLNPLAASRVHCVSFLLPPDELVARVDAVRPMVLATYPSAAVMLAEEKLGHRLKSAPEEIWTGGENLTPAMRKFVADAFGCQVLDSYGASEFLALASECRCGRLHLNSDWAILESVDRHGQAVPPGTLGATTLLTNLANHVQPLIRYDLGDRTTLLAEPCACGSALPAIEVRGRDDDMLRLGNAGGRPVSVLPLALCTVLEEEAGLFDFQLCQVHKCALALHSGPQVVDAVATLARAKRVLSAYLERAGAHGVRITCGHGVPLQRSRSGKVRRVVAHA